MSDVESLNREIERLNGVIAEQEARIGALEKESEEFRDIEANLLRAISLSNSEFRAIWRAVRAGRPT